MLIMRRIGMSLFNELHSKYYTLIHYILTSIPDEGTNLGSLRKVVTEKGFLETPTTLIPLLTNQDDESYHLLCKKENTYYSVLKNKPLTFLTSTERSWLKTLTLDPKIQLFLDEDELYELKKVLRDVEPLFLPETIHHVHQASLDTDFTDKAYITLFRTISNSLHHNRYMKLTYLDENDTLVTVDLAGYKLEYRITQDSFHLIGIVYTHEQIPHILRINLSSIQELDVLKTYFNPKEIEAAIEAYKCKEPLYFELSNARKGFDRVFMHLSNYERITEFNDETHTCFVQLFYYPFDEEELINILISFGPVIKVISPVSIRNKLIERINAQRLLFKAR